jgi:hypothetical protein
MTDSKKKVSKKTRRAKGKQALDTAKAEADKEVRAARTAADEDEEAMERLISQQKVGKVIAGPDPRSVNGEQYLHPEDMYRLMFLQTDFRLAGSEVHRAKAELEKAELEYLKKQLEIGKRHTAARVAEQTAKGKLTVFHAALEAGYGIKIKDISFDDESGLIHQRPRG